MQPKAHKLFGVSAERSVRAEGESRGVGEGDPSLSFSHSSDDLGVGEEMREGGG